VKKKNRKIYFCHTFPLPLVSIHKPLKTANSQETVNQMKIAHSLLFKGTAALATLSFMSIASIAHAGVDGTYSYEVEGRDGGTLRYTLELDRDGDATLITQSRDNFSLHRESEKDFGALIRRMESGRRAIHTGHWERTRNRDEIKLKFEDLKADYDSYEPMDVVADLDDDRDPRRIEFRSFRQGLYGRSPELRFERLSNSNNNNGSANRRNDTAVAIGAVALGAIIYEESRKANNRDRDNDFDCGGVGAYYSDYYFGNNNSNGVRYTLNLRSGNQCDLILDPIGAWDYDRAYVNDCGEIFGWMDRRSRVTCTGTYRREGGRVILEICEFSNGYRRERISRRLCASVTNSTLLFSDYDQGFWGRRTRLCFGTTINTRPYVYGPVYAPSRPIYREDSFGYGDYRNRNDHRNDRDDRNRDGRYDRDYNRNERPTYGGRETGGRNDSRRDTERESGGRGNVGNLGNIGSTRDNNNSRGNVSPSRDTGRSSSGNTRSSSSPSGNTRQAEPPSRSREREGR
jgi:hypothetical protein